MRNQILSRFAYGLAAFIILSTTPGMLSSAQAAINLVPNPSLENATTTSLPQSWNKGRWGTNAAIFTYPVTGYNNTRAAKVELTQRTSGDAKWYFQEVAISPNTKYTFSDYYISDVTSHITIQYRLTDNSFRYVDIAHPPASNLWEQATATFTTPSNTQALTIFHLINSVGTLIVDEYSLTKDPATTPLGLVTLNFDDGWKTTHNNTIPILNAAGFKSTQYIITGRFHFPAYVTQDQVLAMHNQGHEIGAHTRTHRDLTTLSQTEMQSEIAGSKSDLENLGITVKTFAYPFGAYNSATDTVVRRAGFSGARTSNGGFNTSNSNRYFLARQPVEANTTFAQIKSWIDDSAQNETWLVLVFHRVDTNGTQYAITPALFKQIVDYLKQKSSKVVTTAEAIDLLFP